VGKGNVRNRSSPEFARELWFRFAAERPTLSYHGTVIIKKYPSVRSICANPYPLTLVDLVYPIGEEATNILKEGEIHTPDDKRRTHISECLLAISSKLGTRALGRSFGVVIDGL